MRPVSRREFLAAAGSAAVVAVLPPVAAAPAGPPFKISLAQWSLHQAFGRNGKATLDPLNFAAIAKTDYGIDAVEYVNQFYADKKNDDGYLKQLKQRAADNGVTSVLIMCDNEGQLGDPDPGQRAKAAQNHHRWAEWAKTLGCHSIRVNAYSAGPREEQVKLAADGLRQLAEHCAPLGVNVIVENHGGLSSDGTWLAEVMRTVGLKNCGTLPDFGNFNLGGGKQYDRYKGVDEMMPFAKGASAKTYDFDATGNETTIDYAKMLGIVVTKHKYAGFVGIEYEGSKMTEPAGIQASKAQLERLRATL